ncbi:cadherin domain-containing protein [Capilliphycus salinus ALCB114379]|uniref:cadherin domain-containing protein n=1 Tax=Capilliphycus salinus TaxID=2768948 RepID=UPI0039A60C5D
MNLTRVLPMSQLALSNAQFSHSFQTLQFSPISLNSSKTLVFIDANVDDYEYLVAGVKSGIEIEILNSDRDGIEQITACLFTRPNIESVHIVSHGSPGCLYIGNTQLNLNTFERYANLLQTWSASEIVLYGCHLACGDAGAEFIEKLHKLTGADIAASATPTGNAALNGDWTFKRFISQTPAEVAFSAGTQASYRGILANGQVNIDGTPEEDSILTATVSDSDGLPNNITYQWQSSTDENTWTDITGATNNTFTPGDNEVGKFIRVNASYTDNGGTAETATAVAGQGIRALGSFYQDGSAQAVSIVGNLAYIANDREGLQILDISNPASPTLRGSIDTPGRAKDIAVAGNFAYIADDNGSLQVIDISNPATPTIVANAPTGGEANGVAVAGNFAYVSDNNGGLQIIDITDPTRPAPRGQIATPGRAWDVAVAGNFAYVADAGNGGLRIFNITDPDNPTAAGNVSTGANARGVSVVGNLAYVANTGNNNLSIINVSSPASPQVVGVYNTGGDAFGVSVSGDFAYVAYEADGLQIVNVSDPTNPTLEYGLDTDGNALGVSVVGNSVYLADGNGGLKVLDVQTTPPRVANINDIPTNITLDNNSVDENQAVGAVVGTLTSADADPTDTHSYTLVAGVGDTDNAQFEIVNGQLRTKASFDFETKNSYNIRVETNDGNGGTFQKELTINVDNVNENPTDITLSNNSLNENQAVGTLVGILTTADVDPTDTHSYSLVEGAGSADNALFEIVNGQLRTQAVLDFETKSSYSIRVQTDDGNGGTVQKPFTITVDNVNENPTDITLDTNSVGENQDIGTVVGTFSSTDSDTNDTHTYSLVPGVGSTDNGLFEIVNGQLRTTAVLDFETKTSYSIRVKTDDGNGGSFQKALTVNVDNVNENPTDITLSNNSLEENQVVGTVVGIFTTADVDPTDTHSYSLVPGVGGADNALFEIVDGELRTKAVLDFETKSSYNIRVRTNDGNGGTFDKEFTVNVSNVNELPTDITLSNNRVDENQAAGAVVGTFSTADSDLNETYSYSLVAGVGDTDNALFDIVNGELRTKAVLDFETQSSYNIRVQTNDGNGAIFEKSLLINVGNVNEIPTNITLSNNSLDENQVVGTVVGTLTTADVDPTDTHFYTLVPGAGDTDNDLFEVVNGELKTKAVLDFETKSSYNIRLQTNDGNGGTFDKQFTVNVGNINEFPTDIILDNNTVDENQAVGVVVGTLSSVDGDLNDSYTYSLVAGNGDTDNDKFEIVNGQLQTTASFDFESQNSYSIRVQTNDGNGGIFENSLLINVGNVNELPTDITLSNNRLDENQAAGAVVGTFTTADVDPTDTHTYTLVPGVGDTDNALFEVVNGELQTKAVLDFETKTSYNIRVKTDDNNGGTFEKEFTVNVDNVNENPTDITLSNNSLEESQAVGTVVGTFTSTDSDINDTYSYRLVAGVGDTDNALFDIVNGELQTKAVLDFETKNSYNIRVETNDGNGGTFEKQFTVNVGNINEIPTDITLSNNGADENQAVGAVVGTFSTVDGDTNDSHSYSLVAGEGDTDNALFEIVNGELITKAVLDFETKTSYSIRVQTSDNNGETFEKALAINVNNVNDPPVLNSSIPPQTILEDGNFRLDISRNFSAVDAGDNLTYTATLANGAALPSWLILDPTTGVFSGTPSNENVGQLEVKVTAKDSSEATVENTFQLIVNNVNNGPILRNGIDPQTVEEDSNFTLNIAANFTDTDAIDSLSFTAKLADGSPLPSWLKLDSRTGVFSGTPTNDDVGVFDIRVTATDGNQATVENTFQLTVNDIDNDSETDPGNDSEPDDFGGVIDNPTNLIPAIIAPVKPANTAANISSDNSSSEGGSDADILLGDANNNEIFAFAGDDIVNGGDGEDGIAANEGNDTVDGGNGNDTIFGGKDNDVIFGSDGDDWLNGNLGDDFLDGGDNNDTLFGGQDNDTLFGGNGDDWLNGNLGDDFLDGGEGNDMVYGGQDGDTLTGGTGNDSLFGNIGNDLIAGNDGNDLIYGGKNNDTVSGNQGNDTLYGDLGNDVVDGSEGNDLIFGGEGNDILIGAGGNDTLTGNEGRDRFFLGIGNGSDLITDFTDSQDLLVLDEDLTFDDLNIVEQNGSTLIQFGQELLATLENVNPSLITADDFVSVA